MTEPTHSLRRAALQSRRRQLKADLAVGRWADPDKKAMAYAELKEITTALEVDKCLRLAKFLNQTVSTKHGNT